MVGEGGGQQVMAPGEGFASWPGSQDSSLVMGAMPAGASWAGPAGDAWPSGGAAIDLPSAGGGAQGSASGGQGGGAFDAGDGRGGAWGSAASAFPAAAAPAADAKR